jgi:AcrR family transcriptional regulator
MAKGRPRAFDKDAVLDKAVEVFLSKGYEGASLSALTEAMGINPPSLYAAFGNKDELYREAVGRYAGEIVALWSKALAKEPTRAAIEALLVTTAEWLTSRKRPAGCLLARSAFVCDAMGEAAWADVVASRIGALDLIRARLERGKRAGELPRDTDTKALARYVQTVLDGFSVQAVGGASFETLKAMARQAMRAVPSEAKAGR